MTYTGATDLDFVPNFGLTSEFYVCADDKARVQNLKVRFMTWFAGKRTTNVEPIYSCLGLIGYCDGFAGKIAETVTKSWFCSEKQAWVMADNLIKSGVIFCDRRELHAAKA